MKQPNQKLVIKATITHLTKEQKKLLDKALKKVWKDFSLVLKLLSK